MKRKFLVAALAVAVIFGLVLISCDESVYVVPGNSSTTAYVPGASTTTLLPQATGTELIADGEFDLHTDEYLLVGGKKLPSYIPTNPGANPPVDVWEQWTELQLRPASGFASIYDYESTTRLETVGRGTGNQHAVILFSADGNLSSTLSQIVNAPTAGDYLAQVWVLGGSSLNTYTLKVKPSGGAEVGLLTKVVDNSTLDEKLVANSSWKTYNWHLLQLPVTLAAGQQYTFSIKHTNTIGGSGKNPFAQIDQASLRGGYVAPVVTTTTTTTTTTTVPTTTTTTL